MKIWKEYHENLCHNSEEHDYFTEEKFQEAINEQIKGNVKLHQKCLRTCNGMECKFISKYTTRNKKLHLKTGK